MTLQVGDHKTLQVEVDSMEREEGWRLVRFRRHVEGMDVDEVIQFASRLHRHVTSMEFLSFRFRQGFDIPSGWPSILHGQTTGRPIGTRMRRNYCASMHRGSLVQLSGTFCQSWNLFLLCSRSSEVERLLDLQLIKLIASDNRQAHDKATRIFLNILLLLYMLR